MQSHGSNEKGQPGQDRRCDYFAEHGRNPTTQCERAGVRAVSGDPFPGYPGPYWPPIQTWYMSQPDWIIRKCISCQKDFPTKPSEGMPLPDTCYYCTPPPEEGTKP